MSMLHKNSSFSNQGQSCLIKSNRVIFKSSITIKRGTQKFEVHLAPRSSRIALYFAGLLWFFDSLLRGRRYATL